MSLASRIAIDSPTRAISTQVPDSQRLLRRHTILDDTEFTLSVRGDGWIESII
jgi:hypothetical protein